MNTQTELQQYSQYITAKGYSKETGEGMVKIATKFLNWLQQQNTQISTLTYNDITAYIKDNQQRKIKIRSIYKIANCVKHYLNYLVEASIIPTNPALALQIKNTKLKIVYNVLSTQELEHIYKSYRIELPKTDKAPPQELNKLARKRNKILLGLLTYQGVATDDIKNLEVTHLELREGKIKIPGARRSNGRTLKLESHQIFDLYDYINETRKQMLNMTGKQSAKLFTSIGKGHKVQNILSKLLVDLKKQYPQLESLYQIRASVITNWLKTHNTRRVQYMAGHRYVSSTEAYQASNIEALQDDINRYYPVL